MFTLIKHAHVYAPEDLGVNDVLLAGERIASIKPSISISGIEDLKVIEAQGKKLVPGFIDSHVHIAGGGGEGGFHTRTPELTIDDCIRGGITTVIGVIGTDGTTRRMEDLIAKARGLDNEGITAYAMLGSYHLPLRPLTGKIEDDMILIDKIIGVGEIAIADHRSSQPRWQDLAEVASKARVGGILSEKAGKVNVHVGDSHDFISVLEEVANHTDLPLQQFLPTHMNRTGELFEQAIKYAKKGGLVDFTTSTTEKFLAEGEVACSIALRRMLEEDIPIEQITFTSDGQASLPEFDEEGEFVGLQIGRVTTLYPPVREAVIEKGIPLETAIRVITSNPAKHLKLKKKGAIRQGFDSDLVLLNKDLEIDTVIAKGKMMMEENEQKVFSTFYQK
ncbi:beta-aspartyl-peptidase [Alteribacter aurantiacus]|uniref:beta-aspartyl-peptidase n=1 Tax=Alteribacter aurantiacus TaxID=254410 RepID=UPI0004264A59|nr:beta-aspartyl-peptidase [Alteribacter aurantiacus]